MFPQSDFKSSLDRCTLRSYMTGIFINWFTFIALSYFVVHLVSYSDKSTGKDSFECPEILRFIKHAAIISLICSTFRELFTCKKYIKIQLIQFGFMDIILLHCGHQYVSTTTVQTISSLTNLGHNSPHVTSMYITPLKRTRNDSV